MSNLDSKYIINLDLMQDTKNNTMHFNLSDSETSDFWINITRYTVDINEELLDKTVTLYVVKPNKNVEFGNISYDSTEKMYYCNLSSEFKNIKGNYTAQVVIYDSSTKERKVTRSKFKYYVEDDILSDASGTVKPEEQENILDDIISRLAALEEGGDGTSATASNISITDTGNYFTNSNVEGALQEAGSQIKDIMNNSIGITFEYITEEVEGISCTDITLNVTTLIFTSSETQTIIATLTPNDTTDTLTYSSNNKNVATVTNNGVVTAIGNGDCTITITCGNITKTISVSVSGITETVAVTGITVLPTTATINVNDTVTLTATIEPSNASNQSITWSSDNTTVAQVIDGVVTGIAQGTASIGVSTEDGGYSATCNVTVNAKISAYANLFDKDTMVTTESKGINGNGVIGTYDWGLATVPVQANTQYSLKACESNLDNENSYYNGPNAGAIGFADSTGTTLLSYLSLGDPSNTASGVNADLQEYAHGQLTGYAANEKGVEWITFTTPADCCYLLFNTKLKNNADKIQLEQGDTIHNYYLAYNGGGN